MNFELETVRRIAKLAQEAGLAEVALEGSGAQPRRLVVKRASFAQPVYTSGEEGGGDAAAAAAGADDLQLAAEEPAEEQIPLTVVHSRSVGIYHVPAGTPAVGAFVRAGQVLGMVESLKVPNEITAPVAGRVESYLVEEGQGVEYGQPIVMLNPTD